MENIIILTIASAFITKWILTVWFESNFPAHIFSPWSKTHSRSEWELWGAVSLPGWLYELLNCPVCLGTHISWISTAICWACLKFAGIHADPVLAILTFPAAFCLARLNIFNETAAPQMREQHDTKTFAAPAQLPPGAQTPASAITAAAEENQTNASSDNWKLNFPLEKWMEPDPEQTLPPEPYNDFEKQLIAKGMSFRRGENNQIIITRQPNKDQLVATALSANFQTAKEKPLFPGHAQLIEEMENEIRTMRSAAEKEGKTCSGCQLASVRKKYAQIIKQKMNEAAEILIKEKNITT